MLRCSSLTEKINFSVILQKVGIYYNPPRRLRRQPPLAGAKGGQEIRSDFFPEGATLSKGGF